MLYVSTRDKAASYTAYRTLHEEKAPDGGAYMPFKWPQYTDEKLTALLSGTFGEIIAQILNDFFGANLTGRDVNLCVGKNTVQQKTIGHRLFAFEMWHNPKGDYTQFECALYRRLYDREFDAVPAGWPRIAIRIAVLFAIFSQLLSEDIRTANLVVTSADSVGLSAASFARKMGLPIDNIIYCCTAESAMWDFLTHGTLNSAMHCDEHLEILLYSALGSEELIRYLAASRGGNVYALDEEKLRLMNEDIVPVVIGKKRVWDIVNSVYRTNGYLLGPDTAMAFSGQQHYRANTGETGYTLILSLRSPLQDAKNVSATLGMTENELLKLMDDL